MVRWVTAVVRLIDVGDFDIFVSFGWFPYLIIVYKYSGRKGNCYKHNNA